MNYKNDPAYLATLSAAQNRLANAKRELRLALEILRVLAAEPKKRPERWQDAHSTLYSMNSCDARKPASVPVRGRRGEIGA